MRTKLYFGILLVLAALAATAGAQSNTFTYQGRLTDNNLAAVGTYEMQFRVFDAAVAGNQLPVGTPVTLNFTVAGTNPVTVSNGAFTVQLNFGSGVFTGADRWLEISVRKPSDPPGFTLLTPRQPITSSPYSIKTLNANAADSLSSACVLCITDAQISGIDGGKVIGNVASATTAGNVSGVVAIANGGTGSSTQTFVDLANPQTITGAKIMSSATNVFTGSGAGLTNISPTNITPGTASINIAGIAAAEAVATSGATPSVAGRTMLTLNYAAPTAITDLTGGVDGQCVVLLSLNSNLSITEAPNFRLANGISVPGQFFSDSTLTLCRSSASGGPLWYETARSINSELVSLNVFRNGGTGTGTVSPSPQGVVAGSSATATFYTYQLGDVVTLTATPTAGSVFAGWSGGGCSGTGTCVVTLNSSTTVTATFNLITFALTVTRTNGGSVSSSPAGINCGSDCSENYVENTVVTLTRQTDTGGVFLGWGGACSGTGLTCNVTMDAAKTVTATFGFPVAVNKAGAGSGTVTSSPAGISCGATCGANFQTDVPVTLTAVADAGSVFTGWSGSGCSGTGSCGLPHHGPDFVTATFAPQQFTLSVAKAGTGSGTVTSSPAGINCGADCSEPYNSGTSVTLTASPSGGSTFAGWSGGGCSGTGTCVILISSATTVTATFNSLGPALLTLAPLSHNFGSTVLGLPTATVDFTVTNTGGASSGSMVTQLTGTDPNEFQITADTCLGNVLSPGNTCTVTVRFNPMAAGNRAATLGVQATPGGLATSTLSGIGM